MVDVIVGGDVAVCVVVVSVVSYFSVVRFDVLEVAV